MTDLLALSVFGVDWQFLKPFIVIGLAFGGVYALSGVGLVVLYRATGVLNLAFGAIGAAGALIAYYLINHTSCPEWLAFTVCVMAGGVVNLAYGMVFGPAFARRDPLVKMMGTLGLALILLGLMAWRAPAGGAFARFLPLPSSEHRYDILGTSVSLTQIIAIVLAFAITAAASIFLRVTKLGTAMRALANDREITATLGVPVRRVRLGRVAQRRGDRTDRAVRRRRPRRELDRPHRRVPGLRRPPGRDQSGRQLAPEVGPTGLRTHRRGQRVHGGRRPAPHHGRAD